MSVSPHLVLCRVCCALTCVQLLDFSADGHAPCLLYDRQLFGLLCMRTGLPHSHQIAEFGNKAFLSHCSCCTAAQAPKALFC